ncbi:MAG TPA: hypothetical protein VGG28_30235 [Kofleriaceae bacterium]|jgi:hypothetical protein
METAPAQLDPKAVAQAALHMANGARGFVRLPLTLMALVAVTLVVTSVTGSRPELLPTILVGIAFPAPAAAYFFFKQRRLARIAAVARTSTDVTWQLDGWVVRASRPDLSFIVDPKARPLVTR